MTRLLFIGILLIIFACSNAESSKTNKIPAPNNEDLRSQIISHYVFPQVETVKVPKTIVGNYMPESIENLIESGFYTYNLNITSYNLEKTEISQPYFHQSDNNNDYFAGNILNYKSITNVEFDNDSVIVVSYLVNREKITPFGEAFGRSNTQEFEIEAYFDYYNEQWNILGKKQTVTEPRDFPLLF